MELYCRCQLRYRYIPSRQRYVVVEESELLKTDLMGEQLVTIIPTNYNITLMERLTELKVDLFKLYCEPIESRSFTGG